MLLSAYYCSVRTHRDAACCDNAETYDLVPICKQGECSVLQCIMFQVAIRKLVIEVAERFAKLDNFALHEKFPRH